MPGTGQLGAGGGTDATRADDRDLHCVPSRSGIPSGNKLELKIFRMDASGGCKRWPGRVAGGSSWARRRPDCRTPIDAPINSTRFHTFDRHCDKPRSARRTVGVGAYQAETVSLMVPKV